MGTVERGESNLSFQNIARVAMTLGITLSALFLDIEGRAHALEPPATRTAAVKRGKSNTTAKRRQ